MSRTSEEERREEKCKKKTKNFFNFFRPLLFFCFPREAKKKRVFRFHASKHFLKTSLSLLSSHSQQKNSKTTSGSFWFWGGGFLSLSPLLFFFLKVLSGKRESFRFVLLDHLFGLFLNCFLLPGERERKKENSTKEKRQKKNKRRGIRCLSLVPRDPRDPRTEKKLQPRLFFSSLFLFFSRSLSSFIHPLSLSTHALKSPLSRPWAG